MALITCKECKKQISSDAKSCPNCGKKRTSAGTMGCAVILGVGLLGFIVAMFSGNNSSTSVTTQPTSQKVDSTTNLAESQKTVSEIETRLNDNAKYLKEYYGTSDQVKKASDDLLRLLKVQILFKKSQKKDEKEIGNRAFKLIPKVSLQRRTLYASFMEETFVKSGIDAKVSAKGPKEDQLQIKYALMSKPLVYKFQNEMPIEEQAKELGYTKVIYTDGYDRTWTKPL
jgi:hypothetical protein